jgi:outer membrane biosynthesis protein TonB
VIGSFAVHWRAVAVAAFSFGAAACTGQTRETTNPLVASLIFDNASPDAREALTSPIDYRITEDNFSRWQEAQENLDQLPRSSIRSSPASGRTTVDRAVARLQSSPPARQAIESAGISVREFVLETIALAQATESAQTGKSTSPMPILADNYQFVRQYRAGGLRAESTEPPETPEPAEPPEPPEPSAESFDMQPEMQAEVREQESVEARLQVDAMNAERTAQAESEHTIRKLQERMQRKIEAAQERYRRKPSRARRDASRDSRGDSRESLRRTSGDSLSDSLPERR